MTKASIPLLVWIDCEMTGLNVELDELIEVAVVITDFELTPLDPGLQIVIKPSTESEQQMSDYVRKMHSSSGLLQELNSGVPLETAEQKILAYLKKFISKPNSAPLAGNTIGTDRVFIQKFLPKVGGYLHYRNIDVSSFKELCRHWFPKIYFQAPNKSGGHRALLDIRESIRELDYYRQVLLIEPPGPDTDDLRLLSKQISVKWDAHL